MPERLGPRVIIPQKMTPTIKCYLSHQIDLWLTIVWLAVLDNEINRII